MLGFGELMRAIDLSGKTFGRLLVLSVAGKTRYGNVTFNCECKCGNTVVVRSGDLRSGHTQSCDCIRRKLAAEHMKRTQPLAVCAAAKANLTHGETRNGQRTRTYRSWEAMKRRCASPRHIHYLDYGGRGITVCERWLHSFENFLADMNIRPEGTSIDRINSDGNYEPGNCQWSTASQQQHNQRRSLQKVA